MEDGKPTDETDTQGTATDTPNEDTKKDISEFDKLKASNDEFEKELIRGRELKAESQKLEAEKMLSGHGGGHVKTEPAKEETPKEYNERIEKEINEGQHGG